MIMKQTEAEFSKESKTRVDMVEKSNIKIIVNGYYRHFKHKIKLNVRCIYVHMTVHVGSRIRVVRFALLRILIYLVVCEIL